jgi:8-oxo-dGTP pyrophosphatase MutT (NUDIX family)
MNRWVTKLTDELARPLPGVEAQLRLSPPGRIPVKNEKPGKKSAVLVVLYGLKEKIGTVFIKRTEYLGVHSGQVSLPGGMYKLSDGSLRNTALRETREETGIPEDHISIIGALTSLHIPVSGITVFPFVGYCGERPVLTPDPFEVKYIIEANLDELLNPSNHKHKTMQIGDNEIDIPYFDIRGDHIWGATAMIISEFLEVVKSI